MGARQQPITDIDKLEDATRRAKEATREAREAHKDLRACMREFEELVQVRAEAVYTNEIRQQLSMLAAHLNIDLDNAKRAAIRSFQHQTDEIMQTLRIISKIVGSEATPKFAETVDNVQAFADHTARMTMQDVRDSGVMIRTDIVAGSTKGQVFTGGKTVPDGHSTISGKTLIIED